MGTIPETKIYNLVRKSGVIKHKTRQLFLVELLKSLIKSRSVVFSELADKIDKPIKSLSIERRIQDFFQKVKFDYEALLLLLLSFVPYDKLVLSIDRTEWDFGKTQVNILCIVASIGKMAIPLYFEMLDNNSGNSNWKDRIKIFQSLIEKIGKERIQIILMDREFIGHKWLLWLKKERINFCVRVPKHHLLLFTDGSAFKAEELLLAKKCVYLKNICVDKTVLNLSLSYDKKGDLLYLIGTEKPKMLKKWYKKRWTIEVFFQALKGRGFNLEKSQLKSITKYKKLFAVVSIAYAICWMVGIEDGKINPVETKKHGYPQYSVFRRGLNILREFFKRKIETVFEQTIDKITLKFTRLLETVG
jgi:hypothetical protein